MVPRLKPSSAGALVRAAFTVPRLGTVDAVASPRGLVALAVREWGDGPALAPWLEAGWTVREGELPHLREELAAYAGGALRRFATACDLALLPAFTVRVLTALAAVPWGRTCTYAELAAAIGSPRAARAVGGALGRNPLPIVLPCHRVLARQGLGGYTPGLAHKRVLLGIEGVACPSPGF